MKLSSVITYATNHLALDGGATIDSKVGEEHLNRQDAAPPWLVWVPTRDTFGPPRNRASSLKVPKPLLTRLAGVDLHVYAVDTVGTDHLGATETFVNRVLYALAEVLQSDLSVEGGEWEAVDVAQYGRGYVLHLRIAIPVIPYATPVTTTTAHLSTAADLTGVVDFPVSDVTGVPAP